MYLIQESLSWVQEVQPKVNKKKPSYSPSANKVPQSLKVECDLCVLGEGFLRFAFIGYKKGRLTSPKG
ncbi:hypothetical protein VCHA34P116_10633 [Vibrio chagasii]|nr:hypothetical protein VCHA35O137_10492 [Vibrio chagasii]CAH6848750.1 hypothetical protein VCHA32P90_10632 [Vibrio chagasii]CAH6853587.1 hypothetical protein VCHA34P116_10633 [Vibrio chagasii]CAH7057486.1 hypothetical protein VCHA39P230_10493 [Vibrio chagasii]CAH7094104.1 hypothetical protein VCHA53O469_10633 [Vibrio chagasii]